MAVSRNQKPQYYKKTKEQEEACMDLETFLKENNEKNDDEIGLAIHRLMCLDFTGGNKLTLKMVHDILPVAFDKYIERGFQLSDKEKEILINNKEKIISIIKPFYWEENENICGMHLEIGLSDFVDGFGGCFNLDINDYEMQKFKSPFKNNVLEYM